MEGGGCQGAWEIPKGGRRRLHDQISAIAALTVAAKRDRMGLYVPFRQDNFTARHVAKFLRMLLRHLRGQVILLWGGGRD